MQTPDIKVAVCRPADQPGYWDLARDHFGCQVPLRRLRHRRRRCWPRCAPTRPPRASCRRRSRPTPRRGGRCSPAASRRCPTSWRACPSWSCPTPARAASRRWCWRRIEPEESGDDRALISVESCGRPQPQPHLRRPRPRPACRPSPRLWTRSWRGVHHYLLELPGVIARQRSAPARARDGPGAESGSVAAIGAYAVPAIART